MAAKLDTRKRLPLADVAKTLQQGIGAQQAGVFQKAEFFYQSVLRDHPKHPDALHLMGTLAIEADKPSVAISYFRKALKQKPREPMFLHNLGSAQLQARKPQLAAETLRKAVKSDPKFVDGWMKLSRAEANLGHPKEALIAIDTAFELAPDNENITVERGELLVELGRMSDASDLFRAVQTADLEIEARAMIGLSAAHKFQPNDPAFERLERLVNELPAASVRRQAVLYATGKAMADQKQFDSAFKYFETAKKESSVKFAIDLHRDTYQRHKTLFTCDFIAARQHLGHPSTRPVFIVGMPRSGTTLTEQICASHPGIAGAGELKTMRLIANELGFGDVDTTLFSRSVTNLTAGMARKLAGKYLAVLKRHAPRADHVIDKMPHNYELLGLIKILFPNAKIIHCRRAPMDNCLSCFTHNFSEAHSYNNDLKTLGEYYREYVGLMDHWNVALPNQIFESNYEDLVTTQEQASRRLVNYIGLEWDDAVLDFHKTARLVSTPSRWQVRQPIYSSSMKGWKNYEPHLGALKTALGNIQH